MNVDPREGPVAVEEPVETESKFRVRQLTPEAALSTEWDEFVSNHSQATPYHLLAWLQAIEQAYGHSGIALMAYDEYEQLVGVFPLCLVKNPLTKAKLSSLPFCDVGGPLTTDAATRSALMAAAVKLLQRSRSQVCEVRYSESLLMSDQPGQGDGCAPKVRMLFDLPGNKELLFKSYKPKLRSQIRKAEKNGLSAEVSLDTASVEAFYPVFATNMKRLGSPVHSLKWFQALKASYGDRMIIGLVRKQQRVVGAGVVLFSSNGAAIPWASTLPEFNHLAPNMLLYWSLLAFASDQGCTVFDFGRSTLGGGTYRFKSQWGARAHQLCWVNLQRDGREIGEVSGQGPASGMRHLFEAIWQRLPLAVANSFGPHIRKYITL